MPRPPLPSDMSFDHACVLQKDERMETIQNDLKPGSPEDERDWDVLVTTYEVANIEKTALNKIGWRYLIIDEAHRFVCVWACLAVCTLFFGYPVAWDVHHNNDKPLTCYSSSIRFDTSKW